MKFGIRKPSLKGRIAARTSLKRHIRHSLGLKAPRGMGLITNPKKAVYNRLYQKTTVSIEDLGKTGSKKRGASKARPTQIITTQPQNNSETQLQSDSMELRAFAAFLLFLFIALPLAGLTALIWSLLQISNWGLYWLIVFVFSAIVGLGCGTLLLINPIERKKN